MKKYVLLVIMLVVFVVSGGGDLVENTMSVDYDEEALQLPRFKKEEKGLYSQSDYDSVLVMLKEWEGFSPIPYEDLAGGQVIGYGHMIKKGEEHLRGSVITKEEAEDILRSDYNYFIEFTYRVTGLEGKRLLALSALLFNTGEGTLVSSGLYKSINERSVDLEQEWLRWCHYRKDGEVVRSTHLLQRREWEVRFFMDCDVTDEYNLQGGEVTYESNFHDAGFGLYDNIPFLNIHRNEMSGPAGVSWVYAHSDIHSVI